MQLECALAATHVYMCLVIRANEFIGSSLVQMEPHVRGHKEVIFIYGRFPKRNKALGRENTENEERYLQQPEVQKRPY